MLKTTTQKLLLRLSVLQLIFLFSLSAYSQSKIDTILSKLDPDKFTTSIVKKALRLEEMMVQKSIRTLDKLQKQEEKLYRKLLHSKDSLEARVRLKEIEEKYAGIKEKLKQPSAVISPAKYLPMLDSLGTSLKFLKDYGIEGKMNEALSAVDLLKNKFDKAEEIKKFIRERRELLKSKLENLGWARKLKQFNKEIYYYSARIKEYKEILSDPDKIQKKALELLAQTKLFKEFFRKNSMLASLFPMPGTTLPGEATTTGFAGLQTRSQLTTFLQQNGIGGPDNSSLSQLQQNIQGAQGYVQQLRNKLLKFSGGEDLEMPDFKPNNQKTKSFFKRLEFGTNIQSQKSQNLLPVTTDMALSIGYKINDKSILGIATSYKVGWGKGWDNLKLTSEGVGLRSFIEWKIKGSWWISGGYEQNYRSAFKRINELQNYNAWQKSGLIGISKSVSLKSKFLKSTKLQLLWDFLSAQQVPRTQPVLFRVGYSFN